MIRSPRSLVAVAASAALLVGLTACSKPADAPAAAPASASAAASGKAASVVAYCKANGTVDAPPANAVPVNENGAPVELAGIGADKWRCVGGETLVCADSADGDQCSRKDASRTPPQLADACRDTPDVDMLPTAATHFSRFDWGCKGGKPAIAKEYPLDGRGFLQKAWAPLVVKNGVVVSPKAAPEIIR